MDCVVEGRAESAETLELFRKALDGEALPRQVDVGHPKTRDEVMFSEKRTTFGVVEIDHRLWPSLPILFARSEPAA